MDEYIQYTDISQNRERNNASWDRIRHENSASVRSEPPQSHYIYQEYINPSHNNGIIPIDNNNIEILENQYNNVNINSRVDYVNPSTSQRNNNPEELEEEEEVIPEIYCMECDTRIENDSAEEHDSSSCEKTSAKKFRCKDCNAEFNFERNLKIHQIVYHFSQEAFVEGQSCQFCSKDNSRSYNRLRAYIGHVKLHIHSDSFICKICSMEFDNQKSLQKHCRHEHTVPNELAFCPQCQQIVTLEESLTHMLLHIAHRKMESKGKATKKPKRVRVASHKCEECGKLFVRPAELKRHMGVHLRKAETSTPKWKCAICTKEYSHITGLYEHKRVVHGNGKEMTCIFCGLSFNKKSNLDRHVRTIHPLNKLNSKERFECCDCPSVHTSFGALAYHMRKVHNVGEPAAKPGILKHCCNLCNREFKDAIMLKRHKKFHILLEKKLRVENRIYECDYCEKSFVLKASYNWHLQAHLADELQENEDNTFCRLCNLKIGSHEDFRKHVMERHSISCDICQKKFTSRTVFQEHICNSEFLKNRKWQAYFPSNRVVICRLCKPPQRLVSLRQINEHKSRHQPRKSHLCWTCHKSFRTSQLLSLHQMVHNTQPIQCEQCNSVFKSRIMLKDHVRTVHQEGNVYNCLQIVDRTAAMSAQSFAEYGPSNELEPGETPRAQSVVEWMDQNIETEQEVQEIPTQIREGEVRCEVCRHLYRNIEMLCDHWQENESEREHSFSIVSCPICKQHIRGAAEAANHLRVHHFFTRPRQLTLMDTSATHQRPEVFARPKKVFTCLTCQREFKKKIDLDRHVRIHTGEKPFTCPHCNLSFRVKSTLKTHMMIHSDNPVTHQCSVCEKRFFDRKSLVVHMRIHTGENPIKCRFCDDRFRTNGIAVRHEKQCAARHRQMEVHNPLSSTVVLRTEPTYAIDYQREDDLVRTIGQISTIQQNDLKLSKTSAFDVFPSSSAMGIPENMRVYVITKPINETDYVINVQRYAPYANSIRKTVDTVSEIGSDQFGKSQQISIVLHNNMRLHVNMPKLRSMIVDGGGFKIKIRAGVTYSNDDVFQIVEYGNVACARRCDICALEFVSQEQSDAHFYSEDHETARFMFPMTSVPIQGGARNAEQISFMPNMQENLSDYTCKMCGRRFLDMDPLLAHIRKEHDRNGEVVIPPRPVANTAPIH